MDKKSDSAARTPKDCQECDLWWWMQKLKLQRGLERTSRLPVIEGDFRSNFSHFMSTNKAHDFSRMSIAEFRDWSGGRP